MNIKQLCSMHWREGWHTAREDSQWATACQLAIKNDVYIDGEERWVLVLSDGETTHRFGNVEEILAFLQTLDNRNDERDRIDERLWNVGEAVYKGRKITPAPVTGYTVTGYDRYDDIDAAMAAIDKGEV